MFLDDESIHFVWHKLNDIERRLSQGGDWLPSRRQYDSMGRSAWESSSFNGTSWNARMTRVERVRRALELSGSSARQLMARQLSGLDLSAIWPILLDACQDIALYYGGSVIAGAALGGLGGAFFGGVGAVPGAALGATAGAQIGGWVMGLLGLKSLAEELGSAFPEALKHYERGFREAWGPTHRDRQHDVLGLHTSSGDPQAGAWHLAQGHVVLVMALLTALAAWLTRGKGDKAVLLQEIRQSRRLGPRVADWVAQNEGRLVSHPQLRPRKNTAVPERPIMQERAPKSGGPKPDTPKPAGSGGDVGAKSTVTYPKGLAYRTDLPNHLFGPDGFTKSGQLSGTHNLNNATSALDSVGANYKLNPTSTPGISELSYEYVNANGKTITGNKTVYNPSLYSDQTILDLSQQAGKRSFESYLLNPKQTRFDINQGGINFRSYINFDPTTGAPFVGNVHPIK